jgi:(2Fe-2S) ferredoxin
VLAGAVTLWSVVGAVEKARRATTGRWVFATMAAVAVAAAGTAWVRPALAAVSIGLAWGVGLVLWRDSDPRREMAWLVMSGGLGGVVLYLMGWAVVPGALVGAAGAWLGLTRVDPERIDALRDFRPRLRPYRLHVLVCYGAPCRTRGASAVRAALRADSRFRVRAGVRVNVTSCLGPCADGPVCRVEPAGRLYLRVETGRIDQLLEAGSEKKGSS